MICGRCADAADRRAPRDQHCTDPGCTCGHRVERYRPAPEPPPMIRHLADDEDPDWGVTTTPIPPGPTPGCDCGLPNASYGWHSDTCTWKQNVRAAHGRNDAATP